MRQVDSWAAARHLLSPFSSLFLGPGDRHWTIYFILFIKIFEIFKSSSFDMGLEYYTVQETYRIFPHPHCSKKSPAGEPDRNLNPGPDAPTLATYASRLDIVQRSILDS